jgi:hypothetical protein
MVYPYEAPLLQVSNQSHQFNLVFCIAERKISGWPIGYFVAKELCLALNRCKQLVCLILNGLGTLSESLLYVGVAQMNAVTFTRSLPVFSRVPTQQMLVFWLTLWCGCQNAQGQIRHTLGNRTNRRQLATLIDSVVHHKARIAKPILLAGHGPPQGQH